VRAAQQEKTSHTAATCCAKRQNPVFLPERKKQTLERRGSTRKNSTWEKCAHALGVENKTDEGSPKEGVLHREPVLTIS